MISPFQGVYDRQVISRIFQKYALNQVYQSHQEVCIVTLGHVRILQLNVLYPDPCTQDTILIMGLHVIDQVTFDEFA